MISGGYESGLFLEDRGTVRLRVRSTTGLGRAQGLVGCGLGTSTVQWLYWTLYLRCVDIIKYTSSKEKQMNSSRGMVTYQIGGNEGGIAISG